MDFRSLSNVQQQLFQRLIEKLMTRNGANSGVPNSNNNNYNNNNNSASHIRINIKSADTIETESLKKLLLENARDAKNMQAVMEKLKENNQHIELDTIEDSYKNGERKIVILVNITPKLLQSSMLLLPSVWSESFSKTNLHSPHTCKLLE